MSDGPPEGAREREAAAAAAYAYMPMRMRRTRRRGGGAEAEAFGARGGGPLAIFGPTVFALFFTVFSNPKTAVFTVLLDLAPRPLFSHLGLEHTVTQNDLFFCLRQHYKSPLRGRGGAGMPEGEWPLLCLLCNVSLTFPLDPSLSLSSLSFSLSLIHI